jgi:hypothetical protein
MATISTRIAIEGGDEIRRQLQDLGKAVEAAFKQIADIADKAKIDPATQQSFQDLSEASAKLGQQFGDLAAAADKAAQPIGASGEAADKAAAGFGSLGEASGKAAEGIAKAGEASQQAGDKVKESSTSYTQLGLEVVRTGAAVAQAAGGIAQAGAATATLGVQTVTAVASVGTFALTLASTLAPAVGAAVAALGVLGGWLERIAFADARLSETLDHLAVSTRGIGENFTKLQVGQAAFQQIGVSAEKFRGVVGQLAQELANLDAAKALAASEAKIEETGKKALEAQKALIQLRIEAEASDIRAPRVSLEDREKVAAITEQLAKKTADLAQAEQAYAEAQKERTAAQANNLKNIVELMSQVEAGAKALKFDELTTGATKLEAIKVRLQEVVKAGGDVSKSLLQIIANLPRADAFAVGKGFGLSDTDIDRVRRYGAEVTRIPALYAQIAQAGVLISQQDAEAFGTLAESVQRVESASARLQQAWDSTVFARVGATVATAFNNAKGAVLEFAAAAVEAFNSFGQQLGPLLGFGTQLGQSLSGLGTLISQSITGWGILIEKLVTTPAANAWQWIVETFNATLAGLQTAATSAYQAVVQFVTTPVANAWQWIVDSFNAAIEGVKSAASAAMQAITEWVTTPVANAWQWIVDKWNAMLGALGLGGGGSTSPDGGGGSERQQSRLGLAGRIHRAGIRCGTAGRARPPRGSPAHRRQLARPAQ